MAELGLNQESRDNVLHAPSLFEYFCQRTAEDFRSRSKDESPAISFAGLIITLLVGFALYIFGRAALAKATFLLFGLLMLWTVWGVVVRSSTRVVQRSDDIRRGAFSPEAAPFVLARLKWWNHLVAPLRWARHSRIFDRRNKLERRIEELDKQMTAVQAADPEGQAAFVPIDEAEVTALVETLVSYQARKDYEAGMTVGPEGSLARLRMESILCRALLLRVNEMIDKLERIDKLSVAFQSFTPNELSQVVSEAIQVLEERRILVIEVDKVDPDNFVDLVTVRAGH